MQGGEEQGESEERDREAVKGSVFDDAIFELHAGGNRQRVTRKQLLVLVMGMLLLQLTLLHAMQRNSRHHRAQLLFVRLS